MKLDLITNKAEKQDETKWFCERTENSQFVQPTVK